MWLKNQLFVNILGMIFSPSRRPKDPLGSKGPQTGLLEREINYFRCILNLQDRDFFLFFHSLLFLSVQSFKVTLPGFSQKLLENAICQNIIR